MGLFNKKKTNGPRLAVANQPSLFMCDDSEGNHGKEAMLDYQAFVSFTNSKHF